MQRTFLSAAAAALLCAAGLAACGGGGGGSIPGTPAASPTPSTAPTATPTAPPSNSGTATVTSAATAAPIPPAGGYTGTLNLPASNASGSVSLALTTSVSAPTGVAPLRRIAASRPKALPAGANVLLYETITSPVTITFTATPQIDLTLPAQVSTSGLQFFIAAYDPAAGWQEPAAGPASVSGQQLTFASIPVPFTMQANVTYVLALYSVPSATPTTMPSSAPGSAQITVSPSSLSVTPYQTATFTASETGYTGSFTAQVSTGNCYVWATNGTSTGGTSATATDGDFSLVASDTNPCTILVSDSSGNSATVAVTVTAAALSVQPSTLSLSGIGSANAQAFGVMGGSGPYTAGGYDSSVVSVAADSSSSSVFDVTPLAAGQTTITVHDSSGQSAQVSVTVTTVTGGIQ